MDKFKLKNRLVKFTPELTRLFTAYENRELASGEIDNFLLKVALDTCSFEKEEREKRKYNIPADTDLLTEQRDENGLRRYSNRTIDDIAVMVPDIEGFWTPLNEVTIVNPSYCRWPKMCHKKSFCETENNCKYDSRGK